MDHSGFFNHSSLSFYIQAGNTLVDSKGGIKLGDFGVSAFLFDSGDRQRSRNTFVGTPCWMAPEVMEQLHGYDFKADIWSFGITALELAHGHAPFSKYPPMKVLLMTLQNAPPGLDYERDKKFSRSFKQMIAMCLVKNPSKRPSAHKLLKQPFFKQARSHDYICRKLLEGLPTLGDRHQALKEKEEDMLAQKKIPDAQQEEISQNEYKRGISGWNFDIEDLKSQASLIPDTEENTTGKDPGVCSNSLFELDTLQDRVSEHISYAASCCSSKEDDDNETDGTQIKSPRLLSADQDICHLRTGSDGSDKDSEVSGANHQCSMQNGAQFHGNDREDGCNRSYESEFDEKSTNAMLAQLSHERKFSTCSSASDIVKPSLERRFSMSGCSVDIPSSSKGESSKQQNRQPSTGNCSGDLSHVIVTEMPAETIPKASKLSAPSPDDPDDKLKPPVVQQRGRFKVTSEKVDIEKPHLSIGLTKSHSMQVFSQSPSPMPSPSDVPSNVGSLFQQMLCILQTSMLQREYALSVMKQLSTGEQSGNRLADGLSISASAISLLEAAHEREKELVQEITDLQWRNLCKDDEILKLRAKLAQSNIM